MGQSNMNNEEEEVLKVLQSAFCSICWKPVKSPYEKKKVPFQKALGFIRRFVAGMQSRNFCHY